MSNRPIIAALGAVLVAFGAGPLIVAPASAAYSGGMAVTVIDDALGASARDRLIRELEFALADK